MQKFGIDISRWQGDFNLSDAINEGVEFAILKIGGGDDGIYADKKFNYYYAQAKKLKLPIGCYFFGQAMTKDQAIQEANAWVSLMQGKQFEYPVFYDVEAKMLQLPADKLTDIILTVCGIVESVGYWVGIYSSIDFFNHNMQDERLVNYSHWVASWGINKPSLLRGGETQLWQFGGETNKIRSNKICGQTVDQNYSYMDFPSLIKAAGLNGYNKEDTTINPSTENDIVAYIVKWKNLHNDNTIGGNLITVVIDTLLKDMHKDMEV